MESRQTLKWLDRPECDELRRHIALWLKRVVVRNWISQNESQAWQSLNDLNEVHNMLAERAKWWREQWKQEGLQEGRQEAARNLIRDTALSDEMIASATGLGVDRVRELRDSLER